MPRSKVLFTTGALSVERWHDGSGRCFFTIEAVAPQDLQRDDSVSTNLTPEEMIALGSVLQSIGTKALLKTEEM